jgi:hypothetical protein
MAKHEALVTWKIEPFSSFSRMVFGASMLRYRTAKLLYAIGASQKYKSTIIYPFGQAGELKTSDVLPVLSLTAFYRGEWGQNPWLGHKQSFPAQKRPSDSIQTL